MVTKEEARVMETRIKSLEWMLRKICEALGADKLAVTDAFFEGTRDCDRSEGLADLWQMAKERLPDLGQRRVT